MDYLSANRDYWNKRTQTHLQSAFYNVPAFLEGRSSLKEIELSLLGDITGKKVLHLQCHFGQDSISLSRMGAEVTGVDLSDEAIRQARELAVNCKASCQFIECDIFSLPLFLNEQFDIVFTSYGTIGWLPDIENWASIVHQFLKPGGRFVFAEFHPVVWMYDNDLEKIQYSYFKKEAIVEEEKGTYADRNADIHSTSITWNHGLSEVITALLNTGLQLSEFHEYDYSPYNCFHNMAEVSPGKYMIKGFENKFPLVYSLLMKKP